MMCWFFIPFLFVGVISLDDARFKLGSDALDYLRDEAIHNVNYVLNRSRENTTDNMHLWNDTKLQTTLKDIGVESKKSYSAKLQALTDAFHADPVASGMYSDIEQELRSPETVARMLGGAISFKDAEDKRELLQINMDKELERFDGPLRSFMQKVAEHADRLGVFEANWNFIPGIGISWQISNFGPEGLFVELQARLNSKLKVTRIREDDYYTRFSLSTRIQIGYINENWKGWITWKHDETSRRGGGGGFYSNGVECLKPSCGTSTEVISDAFSDVAQASIGKLNPVIAQHLSAGQVNTAGVGVVPFVALADETAEETITASVRRKQRHREHKMQKLQVAGGQKRLRGKRVNLINAENTMKASPATETTNLMTTENTRTASSAEKTRFRIFVHFKFRRKMNSFNVDYGLNFFDSFTTFKHHFEMRLIAHEGVDISPFGILEFDHPGENFKGGGGLEVWGAVTKSLPPSFSKKSGGWGVVKPLQKLFVNVIGGYPSVMGWNQPQDALRDMDRETYKQLIAERRADANKYYESPAKWRETKMEESTGRST